MGVRACALECEAFTELKWVYDHRSDAIAKIQCSGKKIIGALGDDVPEELMIAAGMQPVRIYAGDAGRYPEADKYLEYAFDPVMRAKFQQIVDGTWAASLHGLAISNSTDVIIRIYLYLRELKRVEPEQPIPDMYFIDWLFTRNRMYQERNEFILKGFMDKVEHWAGRPVTPKDMDDAAKLCNENKAMLRKLDALRHGSEVLIGGCEMLVLIGSGFFMDKERHTTLLRRVYEAARQWPVISGVRVFYTGSAQEKLDVYERIEACGGVIVGEDHGWGARSFDRDYPRSYPPVRALVDTYMLREFSSKKAFVSQRVSALNRQVCKSGAQLVLFYLHMYEEAASWDYPEQKKSLEAQGIKTACFSKMLWPASANEALEKRLLNALKGE